MRKRKFFVSSLPLAAGALLAQAAVFYLILLAAVQSQMVILSLFTFGAQRQTGQTAGYGQIPLVAVLTGLAFAILSVVCVVMSFRRREPGWGWRIIPITLLTAYLGSWFVLLQG